MTGAAAKLGSGQASSASDGVVEVAGSVDGGLAVVADEFDGVKSEVVEAGGDDDGVGIDSAFAAFASAAATEAVGKPLSGLAGVVVRPLDDARTFQTLTAGGFAIGLGAGGGAGVPGVDVAVSTAISSEAALGSSIVTLTDEETAVGTAAAGALVTVAAAGVSATVDDSAAGAARAGVVVGSGEAKSFFLIGSAVVISSASEIGLLIAVVEDEAAAAEAASADFLFPPLAGDGPVLPPSFGGKDFFSPCRCVCFSPFSFSTRRALG